MLDCIQRAEKRGLIPSAERFRELRLLHNAIVHDYLIESADRVLLDALNAAPELMRAVGAIEAYAQARTYV